MKFKQCLQRGRAGSVFAGERCFPCTSPSDSRLSSSLCPAVLTNETACCSSDPHYHSLEEITQQHPGFRVDAEQRRDKEGVKVIVSLYWWEQMYQFVDIVPHSG